MVSIPVAAALTLQHADPGTVLSDQHGQLSEEVERDECYFGIVEGIRASNKT